MPSVRVRVPATSANLGPGFDTLGLALNLYNFVTIRDAEEDRGRITVTGEGVEVLKDDDHNIAFVAARHLLRYINAPAVVFDLVLENAIPLARGLGSSAAARVGALVAANEWAGERGWHKATPAELLTLATQLEGHPDNVAAALLGGLVVSTTSESHHAAGLQSPHLQSPGSQASGMQAQDLEDNGVEPEVEAHDISGATVEAAEKRDAPAFHDPASTPTIENALAVRMPIQEFPKLVVFIPETELATKAARAVLPDAIFRSEAIFNISHTALLLAALSSGQWELLRKALHDKLHQEHRAKLMRGFNAILHAAAEAGAYGATLSGAGPSILAWLPQDDATVQEVCRAMQDAAAEHEVFGNAMEVAVDLEGCVAV